MVTLKTGLANLEADMDELILETENKVSDLELTGDLSISSGSSK
jgi:hypothetical protein